MPKSPKLPARTVSIQVRVTPQGAELIDAMRGTESRGGFLRNLVLEEYRRRQPPTMKVRVARYDSDLEQG